MRQVNVREAKAELSKLLAAVEGGERIVIARAGRPIAVLTAYPPEACRRELGQFRGQCRMAEDFDGLPDELARAFEGEPE